MNMGLDYSKILLILVLVLIFFGSKEIPHFIRQAAKFIAKIRVYTDKVRHEISEIGRIDEPMSSYDQDVIDKKTALREKYIAKRKELTVEDRAGKTAAIWAAVEGDPDFAKAKSVMAYIEIGAEVATREAIGAMLAAGKRVCIPYQLENGSLGIGEISDLDKDIAPGAGNIPEPVKEKRDIFFKSDIQFIVCPAVAFDRSGARLGRGKGCYDRFLKEMKGKCPIYGIAFDCQIMSADDRIPFAYHDIVMDQVITESGILIKKSDDASPPPPRQMEKPLTPAG
jgi:5-formyltetrahydrofolate cyclo-ligase